MDVFVNNHLLVCLVHEIIIVSNNDELECPVQLDQSN